MGTAIKHPVPDRVQPTFVIFWHPSTQDWVPECPDVKNYKRRLNPVWHRMLYSCTHMVTVGVKGLKESTEVKTWLTTQSSVSGASFDVKLTDVTSPCSSSAVSASCHSASMYPQYTATLAAFSASCTVVSTSGLLKQVTWSWRHSTTVTANATLSTISSTVL